MQLNKALLIFKEVKGFGTFSGELGEGAALPHATWRIVFDIRRRRLHCTTAVVAAGGRGTEQPAEAGTHTRRMHAGMVTGAGYTHTCCMNTA